MGNRSCDESRSHHHYWRRKHFLRQHREFFVAVVGRRRCFRHWYRWKVRLLFLLGAGSHLPPGGRESPRLLSGPRHCAGCRRQNLFHSGHLFSAPIVAGILAQARAKWPNATSHQLLQLLVNTASTPEGGRDIYVRYGPINPGKMLNTDPSQYLDENPLADKGGARARHPRRFASTPMASLIRARSRMTTPTSIGASTSHR